MTESETARDDARWRRAASVVDAALACGGAARDRLLRERCAGDASLEADVRRWLAAVDAPSTLFDRGPLPPGDADDRPPNAAALPPATTVGAWRVTRFIGAGGMGAVYEAERADGAFVRRAALKLVPRAGAGDRTLLERRLRRERELLARLEHPNIARLLDGGVTADGLPFYVMEYVDGEPIDAWCDRRRLDPRARVALLRRACAAAAAAHRRLVVHRDLKPSNVLVTDDGTVKLVDFGIAQSLDESGPSGPGGAAGGRTTGRLLTPAYASPEQLRGEPAAVAGDVYALGALLYHLLAGRPPRDQTSWLALARAALDTEPPPPSTVARDERLRRQLRGDLDAIAGTALRADPALRYASVEALDADLERWLDGRPVAARPRPWTYRARKFVVRNRRAVAAVAIAAVALVATTVDARRQARRATREAARAQQVADYLSELIGMAYPFDSGGKAQPSLHGLLDHGVANIHKLAPAGPLTQADVLASISLGYHGLGDYAASARLARREVALYDAGGAPANDRLDARLQLAEALRLDGQLGEALAVYREALPGVARRYGPRSGRVGSLWQSIGRAERMSGQLDSAEAALGRTLALLAQDTVGARIALGHAHVTLGHIRLARGDLDGAEASYREAREVRRRSNANETEIATIDADLANVETARGRFSAAESLLARSIAVKRRTVGDDHPEVTDDLRALAQVALRRGAYADAERGFRDVLARYDAAGGPPTWRTAPALVGLGEALLRQRRRAEAAAALRRAVDGLTKLETFPSATALEARRLLAEAERR